MKILWCLLFSIGIGLHMAVGQNERKTDSLLSLINTTADLSEKSTNESVLAEHYRVINQLEDALALANLALKHGMEANNAEATAKAYLTLGNIHYTKWESSIALNYYQKTDSILSSEKIINKTLYSARLNMGNIHMRLIEDILDVEGFKRVEMYYNDALQVAEKIGDSSKQGYTYIRLGHIKNALKKDIDALNYFKKADQYITENSQYIKDLYYALGVGYLGIGDKEKSTSYMRKYFELRKLSGIPSEIAIGYWSFGRHLFNIGDYTGAIYHEKKSSDLFNSFDNLDYGRLSSINKIVYESYQNLGDYENAFKFLLKHKEMNDSAIAVSKRISLEELESKYQTAKKEEEILVLKNEYLIAEAQKTNQRNLLLGGLGITSFAGLFIFMLFRNRQKTNNKLRELDTLKSNFFTNISHEFRTPLTLISTPIQEALARKDLSQEQRTHLEIASRNTERLLSLVDQLLHLSKIDSGSLKLSIEQGPVMTFIAAWCESFSYLAEQKNISFDFKCIDREAITWFDADALQKIVVNLLGNAIKYTPENGQISVKASCNGKQLTFEVTNTGEPLTKNQMDIVFNRFYQIDGEQGGAGIGLSLVKELVHLHQGTISAHSDKHGITFEVILCTDNQKLKEYTLKSSPTTLNSPGHVLNTLVLQDLAQTELEEEQDDGLPILLLVEDNADVITLLKDTFKKEYQILTANNGEEGVLVATEHIPDIIVSDVMMPVMDGIALTRNLKKDERTSHIPIVLLTAKAGDENKLTGIDVGADDYITKPYNQKILVSKVENLIALRKKLRSRYSQEVVLKPKDIAITSVDEQFLEKVQKVLDKNLAESSFTIDGFSEAVHMSRMQLHRKLKALTGLSASEFVRSQRLKLAASILKKSDINISEVGYRVGFNDPAYFTKCFKEAYNCTPSQFVNQ